MGGAHQPLAAALAVVLGLSLPLGTSAQFNFKHFDPGRLASSLAKGKSQQVAHALSGGDAGKTLAKAISSGSQVLKDGTAAAAAEGGRVAGDVLKAGTAAAAAEGGKVAGDALKGLSASAAAEVASANATGEAKVASPELAAGAGDGGADVQPPKPAADALFHNLLAGGTLAKAAKALDHVKPGDLQKEIEHNASPELASQLKPLTEAFEKKSPDFAEALRHTDPKKVEAVIKGTDPKEIEEVLSAYERYHWMRSHLLWLVASLTAAILALVACSHLVRRLLRPRRKSEALLMETEITSWVRTGTRTLTSVKETQEDLEAPELGFQQF